MPKIPILIRHFLAINACGVVALVLQVGAAVSEQADPGRYWVGGLVAIVLGLIVGFCMFAPASFLGSVIAWALTRFAPVRRRPVLSLLAATPFVFVFAAFLSHRLDGFYMDAMTTTPHRSTGIILREFAIYLSLPLFLYWWFTAYRPGDDDTPNQAGTGPEDPP